MGHYHVIQEAMHRVERLLIIVGSANSPLRHDSIAFTVEDRIAMIDAMLTDEQRQRCIIVPLQDFNITPWWQAAVRNAVKQFQPDDSKVSLIGHSKDASSYYLKAFPEWDNIEVSNFNGLSSTTIRNYMFDNHAVPPPVLGVHHTTEQFIADNIMGRPYIARMIAERKSCLRDIEQYGRDTPDGERVYGPFLAADSIVIQSGHVLLIKRGGHPFQDHWAFPGGFVDHDEDVTEASIRELNEETNLKVPVRVLRSRNIGQIVASKPFRDPRGRIVSFVNIFHLIPEESFKLPLVKRGDDAKEAHWVKIEDIKAEDMAFDHFQLLTQALALLPNE